MGMNGPTFILSTSSLICFFKRVRTVPVSSRRSIQNSVTLSSSTTSVNQHYYPFIAVSADGLMRKTLYVKGKSDEFRMCLKIGYGSNERAKGRQLMRENERMGTVK